MFFQKGIAGVMQERLREVSGIDFRIQPERNQRLAQIGSVTGKFGTIDLSSASDSISLNLLKDLLPRQALNWLTLVRSPRTILPNGESIELHMISSMGNGYTFPLQSIIFYALVASVYKVYGVKLHKPNGKRTDGNFAVFGDDIIVDTRVYDIVCRMLDLLGFQVNLQKSFNTGHFRESCGSDFWLGRNVRGVYIKTLRDDMDCYSAINRIIRWSSRHGILLRRTVGHLLSGCRFNGVPFDEADDAGIKIPLSLLRKPRRDANGAVFYMAFVSTPRRVRIPQYDTASGDAECVADSGSRTMSGKPLGSQNILMIPGFVYNADGILLTLLAGHLRDGFLGLRNTRRKPVLRKRRTPSWDSCVFALEETPEFARSWERACEASLVS
jgi:hypothetical protein